VFFIKASATKNGPNLNVIALRSFSWWVYK